MAVLLSQQKQPFEEIAQRVKANYDMRTTHQFDDPFGLALELCDNGWRIQGLSDKDQQCLLPCSVPSRRSISGLLLFRPAIEELAEVGSAAKRQAIKPEKQEAQRYRCL